MGRIILVFFVFYAQNLKSQSLFMKNTLVQIRNPDAKVITFSIVESNERKKTLQTHVDRLIRVDELLFKTPIYLLKNGDYLLEYTLNDYAVQFSNAENLNLFTHNKDYFQVNMLWKDGLLYYSFVLRSNERAIDFMKSKPILIDGYPSKLGFKLFRLGDNTYLRIEERAKDVYSARWFPDLRTFEYYYKNSYTD